MELTLTRRKNGISTYTVRGAGLSATIRVTFDVVPLRIDMPTDSFMLTVGDSVPVTATVLDSSLWAIPDLSVSWSSSDPGVSDVTEAGRQVTSLGWLSDVGLIRARTSGTARISATSGGVTGKIEISIPNLPISFARLIGGPGSNCGVTSDGRIYCWGPLLRRQPADEPQFLGIARGSGHACALDASGAAWCWGSNGSAQLGDGTVASRNTPVPVMDNNRFVALAAGGGATCGIGADSLTYCWGSGFWDLLHGRPTVIPGTVRLRDLSIYGRACGLGMDSLAYCWGTRPPPVGGRSLVIEGVFGSPKFRSLSVGSNHTCGISVDGGTYCWGSNTSRQVDPDSSATSFRDPRLISSAPGLIQVAAGNLHTCGLKADHTVKCWGGPSPLAAPSPTDVFTSITATCGLVASGGVCCWGSNRNRELGDGTNIDSRQPVHVLGTAR